DDGVHIAIGLNTDTMKVQNVRAVQTYSTQFPLVGVMVFSRGLLADKSIPQSPATNAIPCTARDPLTATQNKLRSPRPCPRCPPSRDKRRYRRSCGQSWFLHVSGRQFGA